MFNKNNAVQAQSFIDKVKKQSKNLLKLNSHQSLNIQNLSEAQEVMAKINGYPNWHALVTNLSNQETLLKNNHSSACLSYSLYKEQSPNNINDNLNLIWNKPSETSHIHGILGSSGTGKSHLVEQTIFETLYQNPSSSQAKISYLSFNISDELFDIVKDKNNFLTINLSERANFNVLDKSLGLNYHTDEHLAELSLIFSPILFKGLSFNPQNNNIGKIFFTETLRYLEQNCLKLYNLGKNKNFDKLLIDLDLLNEHSFENQDYNHFSYSHLSNILFLMSHTEEADYAIKESSFTFWDIFNLLSGKLAGADTYTYIKMLKTSLFKQEQILLTDFQITLIEKNIFNLIDTIPSICNTTNVFVKKEIQFCHFNLELNVKNSLLKSQLSPSFAHDIGLLFIRKEFLKIKLFTHHSSTSKLTPKNLRINEYYNQFEDNLSNIFIDETDNVSHSPYIFKTIRECRTWSYTVTLIGMSFDSFNHYQDFITKMIISTKNNFNFQEKYPILKDFKSDSPTKDIAWLLLEAGNKNVIKFKTRHFGK